MKIVVVVLDVVLLLLLLASAFFGLTGGLPLLREARTAGQWAATGTEIVYGVTAVGVLVAWATRRPWLTRAWLVWAAGLTATSTLAPVVWGHAAPITGALSGAAAAAILGLLLWGWHRAHRRAAGP